MAEVPEVASTCTCPSRPAATGCWPPCTGATRPSGTERLAAARAAMPDLAVADRHHRRLPGRSTTTSSARRGHGRGAYDSAWPPSPAPDPEPRRPSAIMRAADPRAPSYGPGWARPFIRISGYKDTLVCGRCQTRFVSSPDRVANPLRAASSSTQSRPVEDDDGPGVLHPPPSSRSTPPFEIVCVRSSAGDCQLETQTHGQAPQSFPTHWMCTRPSVDPATVSHHARRRSLNDRERLLVTVEWHRPRLRDKPRPFRRRRSARSLHRDRLACRGERHGGY